jgi:hypothetical protein
MQRVKSEYILKHRGGYQHRVKPEHERNGKNVSTLPVELRRVMQKRRLWFKFLERLVPVRNGFFRMDRGLLVRPKAGVSMQAQGQAKRSCRFFRLGGSLSSSASRDSIGTKTGFIMLRFREIIHCDMRCTITKKHISATKIFRF